MPTRIEDTVFGQDHGERCAGDGDDNPCNCTDTDKGCLLQDAEYYSNFGEPEFRYLENSARRVVARIHREGFATKTIYGED
jgi:hypothetical protein